MHLFQHNQVAYENALHMLSTKGKATIIYPNVTEIQLDYIVLDEFYRYGAEPWGFTKNELQSK